MKGVGAGFGYRIDGCSPLPYVGGILRAGGHLELLERVWEGQQHADAGELRNIICAVPVVLDTLAGSTRYSEFIPGMHVVTGIGRALHGGADQRDQLCGIAAVEREVNNALSFDHRADTDALRFHLTDVGFYLHLLGDLPDA